MNAFNEAIDSVLRQRHRAIDAAILDFVYWLDRWPTVCFTAIDGALSPVDRYRDANRHPCERWQCVRIRITAAGFPDSEFVSFFRLA